VGPFFFLPAFKYFRDFVLLYLFVQIKFTNDSIDEADIVEDSLKLRSDILGGSFKKLILAGTHATPLAQVNFVSVSFMKYMCFVFMAFGICFSPMRG
jgi:hypothetical protein